MATCDVAGNNRTVLGLHIKDQIFLSNCKQKKIVIPGDKFFFFRRSQYKVSPKSVQREPCCCIRMDGRTKCLTPFKSKRAILYSGRKGGGVLKQFKGIVWTVFKARKIKIPLNFSHLGYVFMARSITSSWTLFWSISFPANRRSSTAFKGYAWF